MLLNITVLCCCILPTYLLLYNQTINNTWTDVTLLWYFSCNLYSPDDVHWYHIQNQVGIVHTNAGLIAPGSNRCAQYGPCASLDIWIPGCIHLIYIEHKYSFPYSLCSLVEPKLASRVIVEWSHVNRAMLSSHWM